MSKELDDATLAILKAGTEAQLRDLDMPWPHDEKQLLAIIAAVAGRRHDYGTCVYAMSIAAEAAFNLVAHKLGVTGFQSSCADMDIIRRTRGYKSGFAIVNYDDLLYPQYREKFDQFQWDNLIRDNKEHLKKLATAALKKSGAVHPDIKAHWERLAA